MFLKVFRRECRSLAIPVSYTIETFVCLTVDDVGHKINNYARYTELVHIPCLSMTKVNPQALVCLYLVDC